MIERKVLNATQVQYLFHDTSQLRMFHGKWVRLLSCTVSTLDGRVMINAVYTDSSQQHHAVGSTQSELPDQAPFVQEMLTWCYQYHKTVEEPATTTMILMLEARENGKRWVWHCPFCNVSGIAVRKGQAQKLSEDHIDACAYRLQ